MKDSGKKKLKKDFNKCKKCGSRYTYMTGRRGLVCRKCGYGEKDVRRFKI